MKNKKDLMTKLSILGGAFGYFCLGSFPIGFRLLFIIIAFLVVMLYTIRSIKNKDSKNSIVLSILILFTFIILFVDEIIIYEYPQFLGYRRYIMLLGSIIVIIMIVSSAINYIKLANKGEVIFTKVLLILILIGVVIVVILVLLKKVGIIP
ncbi:hypothetical protein [Desnuesiella massiliensis]|uniref:hypothetical protein n=1 Tax=Desnuesiella massiliensis TaxID=1650662 RepID=UPI0006E377A7|nr:hypothetical protein [Desnuesiella massiliensis]